MVIIIRIGFQVVKLKNFRKGSLSKGIGLVKSCHLSNVIEQIDGSFRRICGVVLRETPGAERAESRANFYNVTIELSKSTENPFLLKSKKLDAKYLKTFIKFVIFYSLPKKLCSIRSFSKQLTKKKRKS